MMGTGGSTVDDCNDNDVQSTSIENDGDCDEILTVDNCDDNNAIDFDCDGIENVQIFVRWIILMILMKMGIVVMKIKSVIHMIRSEWDD